MPDNKQKPERRALRPKQASDAYGVGRVTLYKWMKSGKLASIKIGGARLIRSMLWKPCFNRLLN